MTLIRSILLCCAALFAGVNQRAVAQERFTIGGVDVVLQNVSADVDVYYLGTRYNFASNVWNVDVSLSNRSARAISGPIVFLHTNSSVLLRRDGFHGPYPFVDVTPQVLNGILLPAEKSQRRTLSFATNGGAPRISGQVYAGDSLPQDERLAFTRTLDQSGQPLPDVLINGTDQATVSVRSDQVEGHVTLTHQGNGEVFRFSRPGYLPVWRRMGSSSNSVDLIPSPRLTRRNTSVESVADGGILTGDQGRLKFTFPSDAFAQTVDAILTPLTGQTLPGPLPLGWSPLQAFWLELAMAPSLPFQAELIPWADIPPTQSAVLARWNESSAAWEPIKLVTRTETNSVIAAISAGGAYALVVPDDEGLLPLLFGQDQLLPPSNLPLPTATNLTASGSVSPASSPASLVADRVTGAATVTTTNSAGIQPSGAILRAEVTERYRMQDGSLRITPGYYSDLVTYQRQGDNRADTLTGQFPMRPLLLLGGEELQEAIITFDVMGPSSFNGSIFNTVGGQISAGSIQLRASDGAFTNRQAAVLRSLVISNFSGLAIGSNEVVLAFELGVAGLVGALHPQFEPQATNSFFVLARTLIRNGLYGLEPVARYVSDTNGTLVPVNAPDDTLDDLPGIDGAGQYLLIRMTQAQAVITGIAHGLGGNPSAGLAVQAGPWLTWSDASGRFRLIAPTGHLSITALDLGAGVSGQATGEVTEAANAIEQDVWLVHGPYVSSVVPTPDATRVPRTTPIVVTFSKSILPASAGQDAVRLLDAEGKAITNNLTWSRNNSVATLSPVSGELEPGATNTIVVSTNLVDLSGNKLEGTNLFAFVTQTEVAGGDLARLIIYEPGATNVPPDVIARLIGRGSPNPAGDQRVAVLVGTRGTADGSAPVILINETTGETATAKAESDGSFVQFISASVDDLLSAVFVNANGTRTIVPASEQRFDDGSVGLFDGGLIEKTNDRGSIQLSVPVGSQTGKTIFKLSPVTNVVELLADALPTNATVVAGVLYSQSGQPLKESPDISFPVQLSDLGSATNNLADAGYLLAVVREVDGVTAYEVVDRMQLEQGTNGYRLATHSPPFDGLVGPFGDALLVPLAFPKAQVAVAGRILAVQIDDNKKPLPDTLRPLPGALITTTPNIAAAGNPSHLIAGQIFTTSSRSGGYAFIVPAVPGEAVAVVATHPAFPTISAYKVTSYPTTPGSFLTVTVIAPVDIVFESPNPFDADFTAPSLSISHSPARPPVGTNVTLEIVARDDATRPRITATPTVATRLDTGAEVNQTEVQWLPEGGEDLGSLARRERYSIASGVPIRAVFRISAVDRAGNENVQTHAIKIGAGDGSETNDVAPSDLLDRRGPMVVRSVPQNGSRTLSPGAPIVLTFNEPIHKSVLSEEKLDEIRISPATGFPPLLTLSADQRELILGYVNLQPGTSYTLTLGTSITDLLTNAFDQDPIAVGDSSFSLTFSVAPSTNGSFQEISIGGGAVTRGIYAYVLDRGGNSGGSLEVFDLSNPGRPTQVATFSLPGRPRDLALIPSYTFRRQPDGPGETNDLLAVVGGDVGGAFGQYLWILDISKPPEPQRLAAAQLSVSPNSVITKVVWSPPRLGYLQVDSIDFVGVINLQALIFRELLREGVNASVRWPDWPFGGSAGDDKNGDGDYVDTDPADELPYPSQAVGLVGGNETAFALDDTDQPLLDLAFEGGGACIGVIVEAGQDRSTRGYVPAAYRTLYRNDPFQLPAIGLARTNASFTNFFGGHPRRVTALLKFEWVQDDTVSTKDLALVTVNGRTTNENRLSILDITDPLDPTLLREILIPPSLGLALNSIQKREDGLLALAAGTNVVLLDPSRFSLDWDNDRPEAHPAIVGVIAGPAGNTRSFGGGLAGLNVVSDGGRNSVIQSAPLFQFVSFNTNDYWAPGSFRTRSVSDVEQRLKLAAVTNALVLSRFREEADYIQSTLRGQRPNPTNHYYVLFHAPGSIGPTVQLALESLDWAGQPLRKRGFLFPPVHAFAESTLKSLDQATTGEDAPVGPSTAWRLSDEPGSDLYNLYLSRPFALVGEFLSKQELADLDSTVDRDILWSGSFLRVSIDPVEASNPAIGLFAGNVKDGQYRPGASAVAASLPADLIQSPNPMPIAGGAMIELTGNSVAVHNGELIVNAVDMTLPGRRLPIVFSRNFCGQALFDAPFGRGWDFNFNRRLVELSPEFLASGYTNPLVVRATRGISELANEKDVLFYNAAGRVLVYQHVGTNVPAALRADLLCQQLGWISANQPTVASSNVAAFYLPPPGYFSPLVKFKDGRFAQLDPDGMQTWFNSAGRMTKIYDRFETNTMEFLYNSEGELVRILNDGGTPGASPFHLDIGYYRNRGQILRPGIDEAAPRPFLAGRIARLRDYTGRTVEYEYNSEDGTLKSRRLPEVKTAIDNQSARGRQTTRYEYRSTADPKSGKTLKAIKGPDKGTFADGGGVESLRVTKFSEAGRDTIATLSMTGREIRINQGPSNLAKDIAGRTISVVATAADSPQTTVNYLLDAFGRPSSMTISGEGTDTSPPPQPLKTEYTYNTNGLVTSIKFPEENLRLFGYESAEERLRSRANVVATTNNPGPRFGHELVTRSHFDPHYNLIEGDQFDAKNQKTTVVLSRDKRSIVSVKKSVTEAAQTEVVESFAYNKFGQLEVHSSILGIVTTNAYTTNGFPEFRSVGDGTSNLVTHWVYEGAAGLRGLPGTMVDPAKIPTVSLYDELDRLISQTRAGASNAIAFDGAGNVSRRVQTVETNRTLVQAFTYNDFGARETETTLNVEVGQGTLPLVTRHTLDGYFRIKRSQMPAGETHEYAYDFAGRTTLHTLLNSNGYEESTEYDRNGNVTLSRVATATNRFEFDGHDRLIVATTASGARTVRDYDDNHNLTNSITYGASNSILAGSGARFDELDRPVRQILLTDLGPATTTISYDTQKRLITTISPNGDTSVTQLDDKGRVGLAGDLTATNTFGYNVTERKISRTMKDGQGESKEVQRFNEQGHADHYTDPSDAKFSYTRGFDGRMLSATTPEQGTYENQFTILGEPKSRKRPEGQTLLTGYNARRDVTNEFPQSEGKGMSFGYDDVGRQTSDVAADGKGDDYFEFNAFQQPQRVHLARGFDVRNTYDAIGRPIERTIQDETARLLRTEIWRYDELNRLKFATNPFGSVSYEYDKQGYAKSVQFEQLGTNWTIRHQADGVGARTNVIYPDGLQIAFQRDASSRLLAIVPTNLAPVIKSSTYTAGANVGERILGSNVIRSEFLYDTNRRPVLRAYYRTRDNKLLAGVRYTYDGSGFITSREYLHRGGRADFFQYDKSHKLKRADLGVRRAFTNDTSRAITNFVAPPGVDGKWSPGFIAREFNYSESEVLVGAKLQNPDGFETSPFLSTVTKIDDTLFIEVVDGVVRKRDDAGNTIQGPVWVRLPRSQDPAPVTLQAEFHYNELDQMTMLVRKDSLSGGNSDVTVSNVFGPTGLRIQRKVDGPGDRCDKSNYEYLYDGINLIEVRDIEAGHKLLARFYYGDNGDELIAGDLYERATDSLQRYYFLTDNLGSIMAVADANGDVKERHGNDVWGDTTIDPPDDVPPQVYLVTREGNDLVVEFSEPVQPTTNLVNSASPGEPFVVMDGTRTIAGTNRFEEYVTNKVHHTVFRFTPTEQPLPTGLRLLVNAAVVQDSGGNFNGAQELTLNDAAESYRDPNGPSLPGARLARSPLVSPFGFQGQIFDADSGLVYMRARFFDPNTGTFLQRDPLGYEDSGNQYAGFANNPTTLRDPTGTAVEGESTERQLEAEIRALDEQIAALEAAGKELLQELGEESLDRFGHFLYGLAKLREDYHARNAIIASAGVKYFDWKVKNGIRRVEVEAAKAMNKVFKSRNLSRLAHQEKLGGFFKRISQEATRTRYLADVVASKRLKYPSLTRLELFRKVIEESARSHAGFDKAASLAKAGGHLFQTASGGVSLYFMMDNWKHGRRVDAVLGDGTGLASNVILVGGKFAGGKILSAANPVSKVLAAFSTGYSVGSMINKGFDLEEKWDWVASSYGGHEWYYKNVLTKLP